MIFEGYHRTNVLDVFPIFGSHSEPGGRLCAHACGKPRNRDKLIAVEREILGDLKKMQMNSEPSASEKTPRNEKV